MNILWSYYQQRESGHFEYHNGIELFDAESHSTSNEQFAFSFKNTKKSGIEK